MKIRTMIATAVLALTTAALMPVAGGAADAPAAPVMDETIHPLGFHTAPPIKMEPVGQPSVKAWYRELEAGRASDQSPWKQLVWFKKDSRTAQKSYFAVVDFDKGTVKELPVMVPSCEPWACQWLNGKFYVGMNLWARLAVFDPAAETLTDLGPCFSGGSMSCYSMAVSPDGMIVMGGGGSDVSLYDPRTSQFTHYGQVATKPGGGTYSYSVTADDKYIYAAVRSSNPWELVRLDRQTKERKVILTSSPQSHMTVLSGGGEVANDGPKRWFFIRDGEVTQWAHWQDNKQVVTVEEQDRPKPWVIPGPGFTGTAPKIAIDQSPILAGEEAVLVHIQTPDGKEWRQARLPMNLDVAGIEQLTPIDNGCLVGVPHAYYAMILVDPKTGKTERIPMQISVYGILPYGQRIFLSGYPSARTMVFDTTRPMTWTEDLPGRPGVPETDPKANPKLLRFLGQDTGGAHIGMLLTKGVDNNIYMIARRHRYFYGFSLVYFNPEPGPNGEFVSTVVDDKGAFDHLQISTMQPVDGGKRLIISTQVQYNKQLPGEAPKSAAVFLFDVAEKKIIGKYEPLAGAQNIAVATMVGPDVMIGSALEYKEDAPSTTFRYNTKTHQVEQVRHVNWGLGDNFRLQADGKLWGSVLYGNFSVIFTMDPKDLGTNGLGRTEDARAVGLCFHQGELYLSGYPNIMRVQGVELPKAPAAADNK